MGTPTITASASELAAGTQQFTVVAPATSSLSGYVYADANNSGQRLVSAGVYKIRDSQRPDHARAVQFLGAASRPRSRRPTAITNSLPCRPARTRSWKPSRPQYLSGGKDTAGSLGGQGSTSDTISQIVLAAGQKGTEYDFGEYLLTQAYLSKRLALASTPTTAVTATAHARRRSFNLGGTTANYTTSSIGGSAVYIAPSATITDPERQSGLDDR